jgi:hypothetical protein
MCAHNCRGFVSCEETGNFATQIAESCDWWIIKLNTALHHMNNIKLTSKTHPRSWLQKFWRTTEVQMVQLTRLSASQTHRMNGKQWMWKDVKGRARNLTEICLEVWRKQWTFSVRIANVPAENRVGHLPKRYRLSQFTCYVTMILSIISRIPVVPSSRLKSRVQILCVLSFIQSDDGRLLWF